MLAGILTVAGSFFTHFVPVIGPFLGGAADTAAAVVQVIARGILG
jgi:hypothetical protein